MWEGTPFCGAKVALFCGNEILTYLRDDKPNIPYPGHWDLPGGGREGNESPQECVLRELEEEFGLTLPGERLVAMRSHASVVLPGMMSYFFVATISEDEIARIAFGSEGQSWQMMPIVEFLARPDAIPAFKVQLGDHLRGV